MEKAFTLRLQPGKTNPLDFNVTPMEKAFMEKLQPGKNGPLDFNLTPDDQDAIEALAAALKERLAQDAPCPVTALAATARLAGLLLEDAFEALPDIRLVKTLSAKTVYLFTQAFTKPTLDALYGEE
jgi:hypothetical protein